MHPECIDRIAQIITLKLSIPLLSSVCILLHTIIRIPYCLFFSVLPYEVFFSWGLIYMCLKWTGVSHCDISLMTMQSSTLTWLSSSHWDFYLTLPTLILLIPFAKNFLPKIYMESDSVSHFKLTEANKWHFDANLDARLPEWWIIYTAFISAFVKMLRVVKLRWK